MAQVAPTDPFEHFQWMMARAHECIKAGFNSIDKHLANPPSDDMYNFLGYCEAWTLMVEHHHDTEEKMFFPILNVKMNFAHEQDQHHAVHEFIDAFLPALRAGKKDPSSVDLAELRRLMESVRGPLMTHLDEEVEHIAAANLRDAGFSAGELKMMVEAGEGYAKNHGDPFMILPFARSHTAPEFKAIFPGGIPWILTAVAIPYVLAMRYRGYWKYSPYAMS